MSEKSKTDDLTQDPGESQMHVQTCVRLKTSWLMQAIQNNSTALISSIAHSNDGTSLLKLESSHKRCFGFMQNGNFVVDKIGNSGHKFIMDSSSFRT